MAKAKKVKNEKTDPGRSEKSITTEVSEASRDRARRPRINAKVSSRYTPDPERISLLAERIRKSKNPALVYGQEIDRSGAWDAGVKFAEQLQAPVFLAPLADRASFPETHPQFRGMLPSPPLHRSVERRVRHPQGICRIGEYSECSWA